MAFNKIKSAYYLIIFILLLFCNLQWSCSSNDDFRESDQEQEEEDDTNNVVPRIEIVSSKEIVDEPKVMATLLITEKGIVTYDGFCGIEFRGATSQTFDKKSYGVETWDSDGEDIDVSLLGMPEEEDWVLHGPYSDKSLMRNKLIYDLSNDMDRYASRTKFVELVINNSYRGVYVFMEKLKRDGDRIAIEKLKEDENSGENVTGGYILKIDKTAGSNLGEGYNTLNSFESNYKPPFSTTSINFLYEYPDAEDITAPQKTYISNYMKGFEAALASDDFKDLDSGYRAFIDVPSFIDFFILNELANNVDAYRLSTFMHKDMNEKLKMGPIWDFNLGFGNADYCGGGDTDKWAYKFNERCPGDFWAVPFWWYRLLEDPYFVAELKARWDELRGGVLANGVIMDKIDNYEDFLNEADAINKNFDTWNVLGRYIWPNNFVGTTHTAEKVYLKEWLQDRLSWMDSEIGRL